MEKLTATPCPSEVLCSALLITMLKGCPAGTDQQPDTTATWIKLIVITLAAGGGPAHVGPRGSITLVSGVPGGVAIDSRGCQAREPAPRTSTARTLTSEPS